MRRMLISSEYITSISISEEDYDIAMPVLNESNFQIRLKLLPTFCFVNTYFKTGFATTGDEYEYSTSFKPLQSRAINICIFIKDWR